jgi:hypothetical protein
MNIFFQTVVPCCASDDSYAQTARDGTVCRPFIAVSLRHVRRQIKGLATMNVPAVYKP